MLSEQLPLREVSLARLRWLGSHLRKVGIQECALDPAGLAGASQSDLVPSFTIVFDVLRYAKTIVSSRAAATTFRGLNKCNLLAYIHNNLDGGVQGRTQRRAKPVTHEDRDADAHKLEERSGAKEGDLDGYRCDMRKRQPRQYKS